ncbi:MAG TPA: hypothetical protein VD997_05010 [Phycisphaerales bacterium]|nr:hypothetical protein [Phycisphaerales bacterium]
MDSLSSAGFMTLAAAGSDSLEQLTSLWLPIVASAAGVWITSAVAWMAIGHHQKDTIGLPNEDALLEHLRSIPPGSYSFPHPGDRKNCNTPEFKAKWEKGPSGTLNVWGPFSMGKNMVLTLLVYLVISFLIAYVATLAIQPGHTRMDVFRIIGTIGVLAYTFSRLPNDIWFKTSNRAIVTNLIDGIAFGLVTGAIFAALWPMAEAPKLPVIG